MTVGFWQISRLNENTELSFPGRLSENAVWELFRSLSEANKCPLRYIASTCSGSRTNAGTDDVPTANDQNYSRECQLKASSAPALNTRCSRRKNVREVLTDATMHSRQLPLITWRTLFIRPSAFYFFFFLRGSLRPLIPPLIYVKWLLVAANRDSNLLYQRCYVRVGVGGFQDKDLC